MVAVITTGKSIYGALAYNERKLEAGEAISLGAINSMADASRQGLHEKNRTLQGLADRNERTKRNAYHVSLSFAKDDNLNGEQLREIAKEYLEGIGFESQPAYVYRHHDTSNDHIHIVTTNIRADGSRINDSFIGKTRSEETRKALEIKYSLVRAEDQPKQEAKQTERVALKAHARYTITETLKTAKPSTVGELNALLKERGLKVIEQTGKTPNGDAYQGYIVTRISLTDGKDKGASVKASRIFESGWNQKLVKEFAENEKGKAGQLKTVRRRVKDTFDGPAVTVEDLRRDLAAKGIRVVEHRNEQGYLYGLHYVDQKKGYVFKASDIGKAYSAASWKEREKTDNLSEAEAKRLQQVLKEYMNKRTDQLGLRSAAIRQLSLRDLQEYVLKANFSVAAVKPHLKVYIEAKSRTYTYFREKDQALLEKLQSGIERLRPEHRQAVLRAAGIVRGTDSNVHQHNDDIRVRDIKLGNGTAHTDEPDLVRLTRQETVMLQHAGRKDGVGGLPQWVHIQNVDWKYWQEKFGDHSAKAVEEKLYNNYLRTELQRAAKSADPVEHLLKRGILVEINKDGHSAYLHDKVNYRIYTSRQASRQLDGQEYQKKDFNRIRTNMQEPVVIEVLNRLEAANNPGLRTEKGGQVKKHPNKSSERVSFNKNARNLLASFIGSEGAKLQRKGLYELLEKNADDEETPQQRQRKARQQSLN